VRVHLAAVLSRLPQRPRSAMASADADLEEERRALSHSIPPLRNQLPNGQTVTQDSVSGGAPGEDVQPGSEDRRSVQVPELEWTQDNFCRKDEHRHNGFVQTRADYKHRFGARLIGVPLPEGTMFRARLMNGQGEEELPGAARLTHKSDGRFPRAALKNGIIWFKSVSFENVPISKIDDATSHLRFVLIDLEDNQLRERYPQLIACSGWLYVESHPNRTWRRAVQNDPGHIAVSTQPAQQPGPQQLPSEPREPEEPEEPEAQLHEEHEEHEEHEGTHDSAGLCGRVVKLEAALDTDKQAKAELCDRVVKLEEALDTEKQRTVKLEAALNTQKQRAVKLEAALDTEKQARIELCNRLVKLEAAQHTEKRPVKLEAARAPASPCTRRTECTQGLDKDTHRPKGKRARKPSVERCSARKTLSTRLAKEKTSPPTPRAQRAWNRAQRAEVRAKRQRLDM